MISATVAGNLGTDAELRHTPNGDAVLSFSVASNRKVKGNDVTTWVRCSVWGKRGEALRQYLTKGARVTVVGALSVREYEKNGETKTSIEMDVQDVALQGGAEKRGAPAQQREPAKAEHHDAYEDDGGIPF